MDNHNCSTIGAVCALYIVQVSAVNLTHEAITHTSSDVVNVIRIHLVSYTVLPRDCGCLEILEVSRTENGEHSKASVPRTRYEHSYGGSHWGGTKITEKLLKANKKH